MTLGKVVLYATLQGSNFLSWSCCYNDCNPDSFIQPINVRIYILDILIVQSRMDYVFIENWRTHIMDPKGDEPSIVLLLFVRITDLRWLLGCRGFFLLNRYTHLNRRSTSFSESFVKSSLKPAKFKCAFIFFCLSFWSWKK